MRVLLLDCYVESDGAAFFLPWLEGAEVQVRRPAREPIALLPEHVDAIVVSGSAASAVEHEPWVVALAAWLGEAVRADVPVLGCCFGHQVLARAVGGAGAVQKMARAEVGFPTVQVSGADPLLSALGQGFAVFASHEDEVVPHPAFEVLAATGACAVHALRVRGRRAWGVQFHVEYPEVEVDRILRYRADRHPELGLDPVALASQRPDTGAQARALFSTFLRHAAEAR